MQALLGLASRGGLGAAHLCLDSIRQIESEMLGWFTKCAALTVNSMWRAGTPS
jgi:hypothetical protein